MLSVRLAAAEVQPFLNPELTLAAINAPQLCVVSGSEQAIADLEQCLTTQNIVTRRLETSHAFHSPAMQPIVEEFVSQVQQVSLHPPQRPLISNLTGTWMTPEQATDPHYWGQQLQQPVQFAAGLQALLQKPNPVLLEVGPGRTLSTLAKQTATVPTLTSLRHPQESSADIALLLNTLGQLWLHGVDVDWSGFYAAEQRQRVPLPTYPFQRQHYWVDLPSSEVVLDAGSDAETDTASAASSRREAIQDWFSVPSWQRMPLPLSEVVTEQCWLVLVDDTGVGEALIRKLQQQQQIIISVTIGEQFSYHEEGHEHQNEHHYGINPLEPADYLKLMQSLQQRHLQPQQIVHLWSLSRFYDTFPKESYPAFSSLIFLAQALAQAEPTQITIVTSAIHSITGSETLQPLQSLTLGVCNVISQEYPHLRCTSIDLDIPLTPSDSFAQERAESLYREVVGGSDPVVAYRDRHRWVQVFAPVAITAPSQPVLLRPDGVYLIAGDLVEGLGLIWAQHLAQMGATLILIGRPGLPERASWDTWQATHGAQDPVSRCLRILQGLEATGTHLQVFSADLSDRTRLQEILDQVCKSEQIGGSKPIHGVIHAGTMGDRSSCLIQDLTAAEIAAQLRSKVQGLLTLEQVLRGRVCDFYLLQSSLSTIVGGVGFAAYAAANSFMDAYAQQQSQRSLPWISVNWDACRPDEPSRESADGASAATGQVLIDLAITPSEVWQVTQRVLSRPDLPQVIVSSVDLATRRQQAHQPIVPAATYARPALSTDYVAPRTDIEHTIAATMAELLGINRIGIYDNFFELGGHSLLAIQAVTRLRDTFQVELPMRDFLFESPTVAGIAKIIAEKQLQSTDPQAVITLLEQIEAMDIESVSTPMNTSIDTPDTPINTPMNTSINEQEQTHGV
ncbi:MAG: KR domain-containing protein [Synechococcales cyanobacterium M58_A2018_015]|nr:KR domain-containing protein [Synechococcales cyanobacterium M58_A2018_015]